MTDQLESELLMAEFAEAESRCAATREALATSPWSVHLQDRLRAGEALLSAMGGMPEAMATVSDERTRLNRLAAHARDTRDLEAIKQLVTSAGSAVRELAAHSDRVDEYEQEGRISVWACISAYRDGDDWGSFARGAILNALRGTGSAA